MESKAIIGLSVMLFAYALFSWSLGRFINRKKQPKPTEFQNFLLGGLIIAIPVVVALILGYYYF